MPKHQAEATSLYTQCEQPWAEVMCGQLRFVIRVQRRQARTFFFYGHPLHGLCIYVATAHPDQAAVDLLQQEIEWLCTKLNQQDAPLLTLIKRQLLTYYKLK